MARFGSHEVADVTLYDTTTKKPVLFMDSLKVTNFENTADSSFASGGQGGGKILTWDFNRTTLFNVQNALLDPKAVAIQLGLTDVTTGAATITKREVLTLSGSAAATLSQTALNPATEVYVYITTDEISHDSELTYIAATPSATQFSLTGTALTSNVANANKKVVVYYTYTSGATAHSYTLNAEKFPGFYKIIGDTVLRNETSGVDEPYQFIIFKAKLMPNFNITLQSDGDPTVFDFNFEAYRNGASGDMVKFIKY